MTVNELIELLEQVRDDYDAGERELRFAYQKSYPLMDEVAGVCVPPTPEPVTAEQNEADDEDEEESEWDEKYAQYVYIVSDGQDYKMPYAPRAVWDELIQ